MQPLKIRSHNFEYILKPPRPVAIPTYLSSAAAMEAREFHRQLPGYTSTPLVELKRLARDWGLQGIFVKDESQRFGLKAFKVLGGSYAVARLVCSMLGRELAHTPYVEIVSKDVRKIIGQITLATATDGNHGRGVAWAAEQLGQKAVVFMPRGSAPSRVANIRCHGAEVIVTDLTYDDTVRFARRTAEENGWQLVQDTSWQGYEDIPQWIVQGYLTMCAEAAEQLTTYNTAPTHVFIQAGVGALAGSVVGHLHKIYEEFHPRFIVMEPRAAACIFASVAAEDGKPHSVGGDMHTIMAGLACGEPSPLTWNILRDIPTAYVSCDDYIAANGIRILANPLPGDLFVEAGESGSVGIGLLDLLMNHSAFAALKANLAMGTESVCLFFNTEGATNPENYRDIVWRGKYPAKW
jgi:diaminopropionate ammonia-lyase